MVVRNETRRDARCIQDAVYETDFFCFGGGGEDCAQLVAGEVKILYVERVQLCNFGNGPIFNELFYGGKIW